MIICTLQSLDQSLYLQSPVQIYLETHTIHQLH